MEIRYLNDLKEALFDQPWAAQAANLELYYMERNVKEENGLRYDITRIPPVMLGSEFVKTKGHYHAGDYCEMYIVLAGEGFFLYQKGHEEISDVCAVKAQKDEAVVIPAGYGHVTINPSPREELKMANWVKKEDKGDYSLFEKMRGACYFYTKDGWLKNKNYKNIPELRFEKPLDSIPKNLDFLV